MDHDLLCRLHLTRQWSTKPHQPLDWDLHRQSCRPLKVEPLGVELQGWRHQGPAKLPRNTVNNNQNMTKSYTNNYFSNTRSHGAESQHHTTIISTIVLVVCCRGSGTITSSTRGRSHGRGDTVGDWRVIVFAT